jgi:hypothetical protein
MPGKLGTASPILKISIIMSKTRLFKQYEKAFRLSVSLRSESPIRTGGPPKGVFRN